MSHVWLIELKFITVRLSTIALRMVLKLSLLEKLIFWRFEISDRHNSSIRHGIQIFFSKIKNSTRLMHKYKNSSDSNHWKCLKSASTKHEIYMKSRYSYLHSIKYFASQIGTLCVNKYWKRSNTKGGGLRIQDDFYKILVQDLAG